MNKTYTVTNRNAQRMLSRGFGIGSEFFHHGVVMVITSVGKPRLDEQNKVVFDFEATPRPGQPPPKKRKRRNRSKASRSMVRSSAT